MEDGKEFLLFNSSQGPVTAYWSEEYNLIFLKNAPPAYELSVADIKEIRIRRDFLVKGTR